MAWIVYIWHGRVLYTALQQNHYVALCPMEFDARVVWGMGLQSDILAGNPPRVQPANGHQLRLRGFRIQKTFQNLRQCQSKLGSALDCLGITEGFCELFLHLSMLKRSRAPAKLTAISFQNIKRKANAQFLHITRKKLGHLWGRHDALLDDFPY